MNHETLNILRALLSEIERISALNAALRQLLAECSEELPHWSEERKRRVATHLDCS